MLQNCRQFFSEGTQENTQAVERAQQAAEMCTGPGWFHYFVGFWGLSKSENGVVALQSRHLGGDFDHGKIMRPVRPHGLLLQGIKLVSLRYDAPLKNTDCNTPLQSAAQAWLGPPVGIRKNSPVELSNCPK